VHLRSQASHCLAWPRSALFPARRPVHQPVPHPLPTLCLPSAPLVLVSKALDRLVTMMMVMEMTNN